MPKKKNCYTFEEYFLLLLPLKDVIALGDYLITKPIADPVYSAYEIRMQNIINKMLKATLRQYCSNSEMKDLEEADFRVLKQVILNMNIGVTDE